MDLLQNIQVTSTGQLEGQNICNSTVTKFHQWVQMVNIYLSFIVKLSIYSGGVYVLCINRWLTPLLSCLCVVFQVLINSLVWHQNQL